MLVDALDQAYRDVGAMFDPEKGCNMLWFGITVWLFAVHRVREALAADPSLGLTVVSGESGQFRIACGPFLLSTYGCGYHAPTDPWTAFPRNDKGAGLLSDINTGQFTLPLPGLPEEPTALVLAHYGHFDRGLEAVYIKLPSAQTHGRISAWGYVEELWRADGALDIESATPPTPRPPSPAGPGFT